MYGIVSSSRKWKPYCYENIVLYTDHEPLCNIRKQKDPREKIGRWILELENLDYTIKYLKGQENVEADYLSQIPGDGKPEDSPLVYNIAQPFLKKVSEAQRADQDFSPAINKLQNKEMFVCLLLLAGVALTP